MSKVAIVTDSNSGITQEEAKKLNIKVIPMPFAINHEAYLEDINLTQEMFYEKLLADADVSTSQPSIAYVKEVWDECLETYDEVVYIPMSSALSNSCASATNEANENYNGKVFVVDNQRISVTQKCSVYDAIKLAQKGYNAKQIHDILMENALNADIFIMINTFKYLKKGGRVTPAAARFGSLLKIKPVLIIKANKLDTFKMTNRTIKGAISAMIKECKSRMNGYMKAIDGRVDNVYVGAAYTGINNENVNLLLEAIKEEFPGYTIICDPLALSITCHIGDGAIAMGVIKSIPDKY